MCQILNIIILFAFGVEIWKVHDILDEASDKRTKIYCYVRLAVASVVTCVALFILYDVFEINGYNLDDYLRGVI